MGDINEEIILEIDRAIAEGKSSLVSRQISIEELEKELLSHRVEMDIGQTVLDALVKRRQELAQASPPPTSPEHAHLVAGNVYFFPGSDYKERKPPQMPEGRVVRNPAPNVKKDASECILTLFHISPGPHTVQRIAYEVYGTDSARDIKRAQMRLHALRRSGHVSFDRPLLPTTLVHETPK